MRNHPSSPDCPSAFPLHGPQLPDQAQSLPFGWLACTSSHQKQEEELTQHRQFLHIKEPLHVLSCGDLKTHILSWTISVQKEPTELVCCAERCSFTIWWYQSWHNRSPSWRGNIVNCGVKRGKVVQHTHKSTHWYTCSPVSEDRGEWGRGRPEDWPLPIRLFLLFVLQLQRQRKFLNTSSIVTGQMNTPFSAW